MVNQEKDLRDTLKVLVDKIKVVKLHVGRIETSQAQGSHMQLQNWGEQVKEYHVRKVQNGMEEE